MTKSVTRFFCGFGFIFEGRRILKRHPELKKWLILPFIIDIVVLVSGLYFGSGQVQAAVKSLVLIIFGDPTSSYFGFLYYPLLFLFWLIFFVTYFFLVYLLASVIGSPFYSIAAENTLRKLGLVSAEKRPVVAEIRRALNMFLVSILRGLVFAILGIIILAVSFIPVINLFAAFAVFLILAFDAADFGLEARGFGLIERMKYFRNNFVEFCGMAAFVALTAFIPGLILLVMPYAVVGACGVMKAIDDNLQTMRGSNL